MAAFFQVLERSASDAMAKGLDWNVAKGFYTQAADVCVRAPVVTASSSALPRVEEEVPTGGRITTTPGSRRLGPAVAARMLWHAAVVAGWQLDYKEAWWLARSGA